MATDRYSQSPTGQANVGDRIRRTDGRKFVTGTAEYAADMDLPNQVHMALLTSQHAHAELVDVDVSAALEMEGVHDVITGEDIQAETNPKGIHEEEYGLAVNRVRYYGEPVAAVAAESKYLAQDAVEAIRVEYERLGAVGHPSDAVADDAPVIHPELQDRAGVEGNVSQSFEQDVGDVDAGLEEADHVVERTYRYPAMNAAPMEPHACLADWDASEDALDFYTTTQVIHPHKQILAGVFDLPVNRLRVVSKEVGGGFGNKTFVQPHEICTILLSRRLGRPVKGVLSRREQLEATKSSYDFHMEIKAGFREDGTLTAWEESYLHDEGAYHGRGLLISGGAAANARLLGYKVPNIHLDGKVVYTNRTPAGVLRGTGIRQLTFARESLISEFAREHGLDPVEVRRRQLISNDECPYETPTGNLIPNTGMDLALDTVLDRAGYDAQLEEIAADPNRGIGVAVGYHVSSCRPRGIDSDMATVGVRVLEDGSVSVRTDASDMGTSIRTTLTQVVSEVLTVGTEDIVIDDGDTRSAPPGDGSHSSRTMTMMGSAAHGAAAELRENLIAIAAEQLEASTADVVLEGGAAHVRGTDRSIGVPELAMIGYNARSKMPAGMSASALNAEVTFDSKDPSLETTTVPADEHGLGNISIDYPCSAQVAIVSIDHATGQISVDEHFAVDDVGKAVNPNVVEGQIEGGMVQGIGAALFENLTVDRNTGQARNTDFTTYQLPNIADVPRVDASYVEVESVNTPGGWKGAAEGPYIVAPVAVSNAVADAVGAPVTELPLRPERVRALLRDRDEATAD